MTDLRSHKRNSLSHRVRRYTQIRIQTFRKRRAILFCFLFPICVHLRNLRLIFLASVSALAVQVVTAQGTPPNPAESAKKSNVRPAEWTATPEPFDGATVEKMANHCVTLETELGEIEIAMMPEVAPESVRSFLNLAATGALNTTTFARTVKDFVIQGGNLSTSEKWNAELAKRMTRKLPDEPGIVKHVRGVVSMARTDEPNSATTHFFILVGAGPHLDGKFSAFGTVTKGIEVADAINQAPANGEKPNKPVRINRAVVVPCKK